jgi:hypothetical protein
MPSLFQRLYIGGGLAGSRRRSTLSLTEIFSRRCQASL